MAKYLFKINYTAEGARGLIKDGGSKRRAAAEAAAESMGARVESFYFAFGDTDAYVVVDMPGSVGASVMSLVLAASGAMSVQTVVLLTPEEIDQACSKLPSYKPPGQ
jgi:uncharacterized protein with GYD domain